MAAEDLADVTRSSLRLRLLRAIADGTATDRTLHRELDAPRTTVRDNRRALQRLGYVHDHGGQPYTLTPRGAALAAGIERLEAELDVARRFEAFLEGVPFADLGLPLAALADAEHVRPRPDAPAAPSNRACALLEAAGSVDGVFPVLPKCPFTDDTTGDVVIAETAANALGESRLTGPSGLDVWQVDDTPPLGAALVDGDVLLFSTGPHGTLQSLVVSPDIASWTRTFVDRWRERAERIERGETA
ncbi:hypothetical protein EFA46_004235 [Halarchaeum sp. CBA1220]|uniref:hypothetical protein n=1 Tax=Halarchaeum sp. CBA1220 TaxID=1853682 RepID=UPI000F3A8166|nr:hypothetical protein [Halarchaeum sp. CBA1220]QLC33441.1 hypothetical protein EFA46_004235 [Halarchaeum sp. CBA1220]